MYVNGFRLSFAQHNKERSLKLQWVLSRAVFALPTTSSVQVLHSRCKRNTQESIPSKVKYATWLDTTVMVPLTSAMRGRYSSLYYLQWQASPPSGIDTIITSPRRRCGGTSNSVTTSITELKEAISEVSRALIDLGIPKDVNAYA